jgi:hypothetical protein
MSFVQAPVGLHKPKRSGHPADHRISLNWRICHANF